MTVFSDIHIIEYVLILLAVVFMTVAIVLLTYHVVLLYICDCDFKSLFFKKLNIMTTILSVIGVSIGQWLGSTLRILPDKNFRDIHGLVVFSIIPRALLLIAVSAVFTMLCKRTTKMLSNLLGAEEQENAAGIREIEKMVRQIDELARTLQTGLASEEKSE